MGERDLLVFGTNTTPSNHIGPRKWLRAHEIHDDEVCDGLDEDGADTSAEIQCFECSGVFASMPIIGTEFGFVRTGISAAT
jgi:hypothetical protein